MQRTAESDARTVFDAFDDRVRATDAQGLIVVRVRTNDDALAIAGHVERRARAARRRAVRSAHARVESGWRDVARRIGIEPIPHDPVDAARAIARRLDPEGAVVITTLLEHSSWDGALAEALAGEIERALVVVIARHDTLSAIGEEFSLDRDADASARARFWDAVAEQLQQEEATLGELERWLEHARSVHRPPIDLAELEPSARVLVERLSLARRAWPESELAALGEQSALETLFALGLVELRDGLIAVRDGFAIEGDEESGLVVATALERHFETDPWAFARAAELYANSGDAARAERAMRRSLELGADAGSRASLWRRWGLVVDELSPELRQLARIQGAELALDLGDVEIALEWAERASGPELGMRAAFVLGRAALARGDLVSADAALERALSLSQDAATRLEVLAVSAEVRYAAGDFEQAERIARDVCDQTGDLRVRLAARNLLGKLLLARAEWTKADQHFAIDACDAACAGDLVGELRARLNRAIALLSSGSSEQARTLLEQVLHTGEERGEVRAVAFALTNLAVLAIERHEYAEALELSERAIALRRRLGDRLGFVRTVQNVVELRLRLGLVDQADQALRFGKAALGPGVPPGRLAGLAVCAARIHLERGHTLEAEREVRSALRLAACESKADKLGECHRLAARIALEDGLIARAEAEIEKARTALVDAYAAAEVALLEALVARSAGRPAGEIVERAVMLAREAGDEELAREAHVLAAEIALAEHDRDTAREHVTAAIGLRDEIASRLGAELRDAYLARKDMLDLARLERLDQEAEPEPAPVSLPPPRPSAPRTPYVGRHPRVLALLESARRVARTGATVLIHGESGTGKELISELIHSGSDRSGGPLVKVNCAALVETLLLSELFGHEKGAFTGAAARKRGRFERANGGTLFLDEIGDISPRTQVALLRVLEERKIERVGGNAPIPVDVRIVCATNRDLRAMVESGQFREDLYYRLAGLTLEVPPLRERTTDLPLLGEAILGRIGRERGEPAKVLSADALELLARHRWPGNVRELENALRAASLFCDGNVVGVRDLVEHVESLRKTASEPVAVSRPESSRPSSMPPARLGEDVAPEDNGPVSGVAYREILGGVSLSDLKRTIERDCIARALEETHGNITRAAALLGMKRPRLSQLVKQYGLLDSDEEES